MIHVIPTLIGEGIPLIAPARRTVPLKLQRARSFQMASSSSTTRSVTKARLIDQGSLSIRRLWMVTK